MGISVFKQRICLQVKENNDGSFFCEVDPRNNRPLKTKALTYFEETGYVKLPITQRNI